MIAHISVPAREPRAAAALFAKLVGGVVMPFPVVQGAYVAMAEDGSVGIEVVPARTAYHPGAGEPDGRSANGPEVMPWETEIRYEAEPVFSGFHAAITSPLAAEEIVELVRAMGWRAVPCDRGGVFDLVEVWIDNRFMLEFLPPRGARRYAEFYRPAVASRMFGAPLPA